MSQRRQKKDLSIRDNVSSLTDQELRAALKKYDISPGPITDSTRNLYRNKLVSLIETEDNAQINSSESTSVLANLKAGVNEAAIEEENEEDSSDEDFEVQDEDLEEEDEEYEDECDEEEDLMSELQDDEATLSRINNSGFNITTHIDDPEASATWVSRGLMLFITSFFAVIFGVYLVSSNNSQLLEPLKPITRWFLLALILSPFVFIVYKTYRFYKNRRHQEGEQTCHLVNKALALLQSPDNPKGMMPILHIRDTLLTPAERKTKQMNLIWQKAVKFVEEHESRVKVELVNIDGEDFRAWKWIGPRKL